MPAQGPWPTPGCFDDVRILEIGDEKGDFCGRLLSGEGAEVIKVEPPGGSPTRRIGPFYEDKAGPDRSLFFWMYNRGKRGVTLDLTTQAGREAYLRLGADAQVIVDAQGPGVMDGMSLGYERVLEMNPAVVYCSITPFGQTGPWRGFQGSDLVHMALGGSAHCIGYDQISALPDGSAPSPALNPRWDTPPIMPQSWHTYCIGGQHAAMAVTAALFHRQMTGEGQFIDVSIHDACAQNTEATVLRYIYNGTNSPRRLPNMALCGDGMYVNFMLMPPANLHMIATRLAEAGLGAEVGDVEAYADPKTARDPSTAARLTGLIRTWAGGEPSAEVFSMLQACRAVSAPVHRPEDLLTDPQAIEREDFVEIEHPELGRSFAYPRHPRRQTETPWRWGSRAPLLGEHNGDLLG